MCNLEAWKPLESSMRDISHIIERTNFMPGYDFQLSKFNRAIQSRRQTGSSFKPIVYGAAFEKGLTPADTIFDEPIAIPIDNKTVYAPKNYYGKYSGIVTIQRALELSINVPAVKTWMMVGSQRVTEFAHRLGITSDIPPYPSTALGAAGVAPIELTAAYNVFANQGVYVKPQMIRKIVAGHEFVGREKPYAGASAQFAGVGSRKKFLALIMGAHRLHRQDRRNFLRVEIVAGKPQCHEGLAVGLHLSLRRGGCQAAPPLYRASLGFHGAIGRRPS